ncbi:hypothetical protein FOI42_RS03840 [Escherichia coli]|nr:hypothetical protein [Escherichia coli]EFL4883736.1 hypothetical protein [Escherichia coli]MED6699442.1 hypothetical protein [Escherichia coli O157]USL83552.1 hypothetical protein A4_476 [Escherichia phage A4]HCQ0858550.1 hypothetical protein [Escherichia coli]
MAKQPKKKEPEVKVKKVKVIQSKEQRTYELRKAETLSGLQSLRKQGVLTRAQYRELVAQKGF